MRVQSDSFSFSLHGTVVLVGAVLVLCGCQAPDPYAPFNRAPIDMDTSPSTSWEGVRDHTTLPTAGSTEKWPGPLVRDILQLGPWPPASPQQRAALDSAWQQFTAFEGTRIAVNGIDSVLQREGAITQGAQDITDALSRFHQHFPAAPIPHVDMGYTGYNYSVYPTDELLLLGCEFFIGSDHPAVKNLPPHIYPGYMQERMVPEHLVADALRGWLLVQFQQGHYPAQGQLSQELLYWGKVLFIARCIAPELPPQTLMDWTPAEWQWAQDHEMQVWVELRKEEFLYTTKRMDIQRWVADAPFTKAGAVPQESPDRLGWYMGLRWVEDFMLRHPEMSLSELMDQHEVLPFLQSFRPKA